MLLLARFVAHAQTSSLPRAPLCVRQLSPPPLVGTALAISPSTHTWSSSCNLRLLLRLLWVHRLHWSRSEAKHTVVATVTLRADTCTACFLYSSSSICRFSSEPRQSETSVWSTSLLHSAGVSHVTTMATITSSNRATRHSLVPTYAGGFHPRANSFSFRVVSSCPSFDLSGCPLQSQALRLARWLVCSPCPSPSLGTWKRGLSRR